MLGALLDGAAAAGVVLRGDPDAHVDDRGPDLEDFWGWRVTALN